MSIELHPSLIHALHRLCEKVRSMFKDLNTLVKNGKKIFIKAPNRQSDWKQSTDLTLPPQAVVTRWGTWIVAVLWFSEHIDVFEAFVNTLNPDDAQSIEDAQEVLKVPNLRDDLHFVASHLGFLPPLMKQIEKPDVGLVEGLFHFEKAEKKISEIPGARGEALQQKFSAVKNRNPDLKKLQEIRDKIDETCYMPDMRDFKNFTHAPVHTADNERSFSIYNAMLYDRRTNWTDDNIKKHVVVHCYYNRKEKEPLGFWDPMLQLPNE